MRLILRTYISSCSSYHTFSSWGNNACYSIITLICICFEFRSGINKMSQRIFHYYSYLEWSHKISLLEAVNSATCWDMEFTLEGKFNDEQLDASLFRVLLPDVLKCRSPAVTKCLFNPLKHKVFTKKYSKYQILRRREQPFFSITKINWFMLLREINCAWFKLKLSLRAPGVWGSQDL